MIPLELLNRAACLEVDPEIFFPKIGQNATEAKAVCQRCPITAECLAEALTHGEGGIYGGTSETERKRMKRTGRREPRYGLTAQR